MPVSQSLPYQWYDTPNIHLCTVADFDAFLRGARLRRASTASCSRGGRPVTSLPNLLRRARDLPLSAAMSATARTRAAVDGRCGTAPRKETWREALFNRRMLICVFTGFSSGLPLYLLINLLPAWLRTEGVDLKTIGFFALIQFPYTWKFLWSPLLDRYALPLLGRRRGWMLVTQVVLLVSIPLFGALRSAARTSGRSSRCRRRSRSSRRARTSSLDAYRREILPDAELGLGTSIHVQRVSHLEPRAGLARADPRRSPAVVDACSRHRAVHAAGHRDDADRARAALVHGRPRTLREAVVEPFHEFITRTGWRAALLVLLFIFLYKLGDSMATALATPFYLDMGFTKTDIGVIAKNAGLWASVVGGLLGGLWMVKIGINRGLWLFGVVQLVSILGFAWLAYVHRAEPCCCWRS